jgi:hypothetical protein
MERARFVAVEASANDGKPRVFARTVNWKIPPAVAMPVAEAGTIAEFSVDSAGRVSRCTETTIGEPKFGLAELCDVADKPEMVAYFVGTPLIPSGSAYLRMLVRPNGIGQAIDEAPSDGVARRRIFQAIFDVRADGFASNCKVQYADPAFPPTGFCNVFSKTSADFLPDSARTIPLGMQLILEAWNSAAEPDARNR